MIYKGTNYDFCVPNCTINIHDNCHDFNIDSIVAELSIPIPVMTDLKMGYFREFGFDEDPDIFIRAVYQADIRRPFSLCAGGGDKVYAISIFLGADEIVELYKPHVTIPELTDEIKSDVLKMPVVAKTTADDPENIKKAADLIRKLARFEIRMANPELINVPGWDTLENCAADELIDKITKWLESKH